MKDYAMANRAMGTGTLMVTIIATVVGVVCNYCAYFSARGLIAHLAWVNFA